MKLPLTSALLSLLALHLPLDAQGYADSSGAIAPEATRTANADFDAGMEALMAGEFAKALPLLERAAATGDAMAQYATAKLLRRGLAGVKDAKRAVELLERATSGTQRFPDALTELANCLQYGTGTAEDKTRAVALLEQAAACDHADAMLGLGCAYLLATGVGKDPVRAFAWFSRAADLKQPYAIQNLAATANKMSSDEITKGKALAAEMRVAPRYQGATIQFQFDLKSAMHAAFVKGSKAYEDRRLAEARTRLEPLAIDGHPGSLFYVARMHETGRGYTQDFAEAARIYNVAMQKGEGTSIGNLARLYQNGLGVPKDRSAAVQLWYAAAWRGDVDSQNDYALACIQAAGRERDPVAAYVWWKLAADAGKQQAANNLRILLDRDLPQARVPEAEQKLAEVRKAMKEERLPRTPFLKLDAPRLLERKQGQQSYAGSDAETKHAITKGEDDGRNDERNAPRGGTHVQARLEPFTSRDGNLALRKPRGWKANVGDVFGPGTYGVTCENPAETAGILFVVFPGVAARFPRSKDFAQQFLDGMRREFEDFRIQNSISSPDGSKTRIDASFVDEGKRSLAVFQFTVEDGDARVMGMGSVATEWKTMKPMLEEMALSVRYPAQGPNSNRQGESGSNDRDVERGHDGRTRRF